LARRVFQYEPLTRLSPDVTLGIKLPFNKNAGGSKSVSSAYNSDSSSGIGVFTLSVSIEDQASSNVKNLLLTAKGERVFQPDFGTNIQRSLFENMTQEFEIELEDSLTADIKRWLPYIQIVELDVQREIDAHAVLIRLIFRVSDNGANQEIVLYADQEFINIVDTDTESTNITSTSTAGGY
jgi:phage baseplate assembly protein W